MLPLSIGPLDLHPQDLSDALPPPEVQGGVNLAPGSECGLVFGAVQLGARDEQQQPGSGVVVGCRTPVLCRTGVLIRCDWPACGGAKGRG